MFHLEQLETFRAQHFSNLGQRTLSKEVIGHRSVHQDLCLNTFPAEPSQQEAVLLHLKMGPSTENPIETKRVGRRHEQRHLHAEGLINLVFALLGCR